jgi:hypothetical protein
MSAKTRRHQQQRQQASPGEDEIDLLERDPDFEAAPEPTLEESLDEEHDRLQYLNNDAPDEPAPEPEEEDPYAVLERQFKEVKASNETLAAERSLERQRLRDLEVQTAQHQTNELHQHRTIIEHAIAAADAEKTDLKRAYREAREFGDIDAELAAQEALFEADYKLRQLHTGHEAIRQRINTPQTQQKQPAAPAGDPVEHIITTNFSNPRDQAWLRQHKADIFGNERRQKLALAGHEVAVLKGIEPGTDAYYDFMDGHMGYEAEEPQEASEKQQKGGARPQTAPPPVPAVQRKKPPVSAPPARGNPSKAAQATADENRASPALKALAEDLGMSVSEYMQNQAAIKANGGMIPGATRTGKGF